MKCNIRNMTDNDVVEAAQTTADTMNDSYLKYEEDHYPLEAHEFDISHHNSERYLEDLESEASYSFVVDVDEKIVGLAKGKILGRSGLAQLGWICIHPGYQKNGLGEQLLSYVIEYCKDQGCHKISLNTMGNLVPTMSLYSKLGFFEEAKFEKHWWKVNFIQMSKWLE